MRSSGGHKTKEPFRRRRSQWTLCGSFVLCDVEVVTPGGWGLQLSNIDSLLSNIDSLLSNIDSLLSNIDSLLSNIDSLLSNSDSLLSNIDSLLSNIDSLLSNIDSLLSNIDSLLSRKNFLEFLIFKKNFLIQRKD